MCAVVGVFILTLPVPIVVNSFASYYKNRLWRNEVAHKRRLRAAEQTRMVRQIMEAAAASPSGSHSRRPSECCSPASSLDENEDEDPTEVTSIRMQRTPSKASAKYLSVPK